MDELIHECVSLVTANGGSLNYRDLLAAIPPEKRGNLPRSLKQARASGLLTQEVKLVDGVVVHTYKTV